MKIQVLFAPLTGVAIVLVFGEDIYPTCYAVIPGEDTRKEPAPHMSNTQMGPWKQEIQMEDDYPFPEVRKELERRIALLPRDGIVTISRKQYVEWINNNWPDKDKIANQLADYADNFSRGWPLASRNVTFRLIALMGMKVTSAYSSNECFDALIEVLKYLSCPEPGWEGVTLKIVD